MENNPPTQSAPPVDLKINLGLGGLSFAPSPAEKAAGNGTTAVGPAAEGGTNGAATKDQTAPGDFLHAGEWLRVHRHTNLDGTSSYSLCGQLPVFDGVAPSGLKDLVVSGQRPDVWG